MQPFYPLLTALALAAPASPPELIEVAADPEAIELAGPRASYGILVHGRTAEGRWIDLTHQARFESRSPAVASVSERGLVRGVADGQTAIEIEAAGRALSVPVRVAGAEMPVRYNFVHDVEPLLARFGCNASGCHGKAEGQNGFKLSVFGYDPRADYQALLMEGRGRRVFPADPDRSLLLLKASGALPHGGGIRISPQTEHYQTLRGWIAAGAPLGSADDPRVVAIELAPRERIMLSAERQQLRVVARYSDGRRSDVTRLARFQSNNDALAGVDEHGLVATGQVPGQAAVMAAYGGLVDVLQVLIPQAAPDAPGGGASDELFTETNFIDALVHKKLAQLNIVPSGPAGDEEFLRRVYLDIIGTLPTAREARQFLSDSTPDRRKQLVDRLLERPEYADYWALRWADLLRVDRRVLGHQDALAYYKWIHASIAANKPLDALARELITAEGPLAEAPQGHFYKVVSQPGEMAATLSQVFLGVRIACAECHQHPADRWGQADYQGMKAFFDQVRRKSGPQGDLLLAEGSPQAAHPRTGEPIHPFALGTEMPAEAPAGDRRRALAAELTAADNPWFARSLANRYVAHFLGRGLVEPVDDLRETNPPTNPELLDALADYLVKSGFDARALIRAIAASQTYQRSSQAHPGNVRDEQNYSRALFRRLPAEVLFDAVCQATGVSERFDGTPSGYRAIQLWDSEASHYFLKLFGRPVRVTACECERNAEPSIGQVLHLMNSPEIERKLAHEGGAVARLLRATSGAGELADELYLTILSRFPTPDERRRAVEYLGKPGPERRAAEDLAWSLLNTLEFVFNH